MVFENGFLKPGGALDQGLISCFHNVCNVCRVGEERKSVSLHCTPGVYSSNSLAKATVGEPEKDKIVLSLGRVNIPIFAGYSLSILTILVSILINFPL